MTIRKLRWILFICLLGVTIAFILWPVGTPLYVRRGPYTCPTNLFALNGALEMYALDNGDRLPPAPPQPAPDAWVPAIQSYLKFSILPKGERKGLESEAYCPLDTVRENLSSYRMDTNMYGRRLSEVRKRHDLILLEEDTPRHQGKRYVLLGDGTVGLRP